MGWMGKCTCVNHKRNEDIYTEFKNKHILDKILKYNIKWTQCVDRMQESRCPKLLKITHHMHQGMKEYL
jgi:hypothetical protein